MPLINGDDFVPEGRYQGGHFNTLYPYFVAPKPDVPYIRERLTLSDGDFLDIDVVRRSHDKVMFLLHGLEGSSSSGYMLDFAHQYQSQGYDVIAVNYRGCSGHDNLKLQMYNSGKTDDIHEVIEHYKTSYKEIYLTGFSLGGNLLLKYLGENSYPLDTRIRRCIAISTPVHLSDGSQRLLKRDNLLYQFNFLSSLLRKMIRKKRKYPDQMSIKPIYKTTNLYRFDEYFTAPLFGYDSAEDYYAQNQSIQWLHQIRIPTLLINAHNDPFLGPKSYPKDIALASEHFHLCVPKYGGHVGFHGSLGDRSWIFDKVNTFLSS